MACQTRQNGRLRLTWRLPHLPVVGHDEQAEKAVDDGERHDQRVETVAQLLPLDENKEECQRKGETFSEQKYYLFLSISNFQKKPVALLAVHVTLYWQEEDWQEAHFAKICDVAFTEKFYCECDVAKSLRNGPRVISFKPRKPKVRVELRIIFYRLIFKMACV